MKTKKMRIIVTGAAGFIGKRLIDQLTQQNHDVVAMLHDARDAPQFSDKLETFVADITAPDSLQTCFRRCDCVIHLAGSTIAKSKTEFHRINHDGTRNVARACLTADSPPKLLYVSSLAAGGPALWNTGGPALWNTGGPALWNAGGPASLENETPAPPHTIRFQPRTESDLPDPVSDYGRSKLAAERTLRSLAGEMPIQIVRPPSVFGETDPFMRSFFLAAAAGWVAVPGNPDHRYSLIHVDDLCAAMIHIASRDDFRVEPNAPADSPEPVVTPQPTGKTKSSGLAYLAQGQALTFPHLANMIAAHSGRHRVRTLRVPSWFMRTVATANTAAMLAVAKVGIAYRPLLNRDKMREALAGSWACDASRLTGEIGFKFPLTLDQRIQQTVEGYRK